MMSVSQNLILQTIHFRFLVWPYGMLTVGTNGKDVMLAIDLEKELKIHNVNLLSPNRRRTLLPLNFTQ